MNSRTLVHAAILGAFCLGFGIILAATNDMTADRIKLETVKDMQRSLEQVIPPGLHDNNLVKDAITIPGPDGKPLKVFRAMKGGKMTGVAYQIVGQGYAGEIKLMLAVAPNGHVLGVRATEEHETPGLGDKIDVAKTDWITHFTGRWLGNPPLNLWKVKKDGGVFDQFSGATITPRGVVRAIRLGLEFFAAHKAQMLEVR